MSDSWLDALVRHQIQLQRFNAGLARRSMNLLDASEEDLAARLRNRLPNVSLTSRARLDQLEKAVQELRNGVWSEIGHLWGTEMRGVAKKEPVFMAQALRAVTPENIDSKLPPADRLQALVSSRPFAGKYLREWSAHLRATDRRRIIDQIRIGLVQGESPETIVRRVVGSRAQRGRDGVTALARNDIKAIVRTATTHFSNQAARLYVQRNAKLFKGELYVAILDGNTTPRCRVRHGKMYPVGAGDIPPLHVGCRSRRVPVLKGSDFEIPSYGQWLRRQSAAFQDEVLGPTRGRLFRAGQLAIDRFSDRKNDELLTLEEVAQRDRAAFVKAGLNPREFE